MGLQGWLDLGGGWLLGSGNTQHSQEAVPGTQGQLEGRMVSSLVATGTPCSCVGYVKEFGMGQTLVTGAARPKQARWLHSRHSLRC